MQLPLPVRLPDEASFENFLAHVPVRAAFAQLREALLRPACRVFLHGPEGSGRTHLLQASCLEAESRGIGIAYLPLAELRQYPAAELLADMEDRALVCIDDMDAVAGDAAWEEALFHFYNRLTERGGGLLVAAREPPAVLAIALPDLRSRLQSLLVLALAEPDDEAKLEALVLRSHNRGMTLEPEVARFILQRSARGMAALLEVLERLDAASLAAGRRLSIPFVKEVTGW